MPSSKEPAADPQAKALARLVKALERQTEAIDRLAASNEALVDALMDQGTEPEAEGDESQATYMDGTPIRDN